MQQKKKKKGRRDSEVGKGDCACWVGPSSKKEATVRVQWVESSRVKKQKGKDGRARTRDSAGGAKKRGGHRWGFFYLNSAADGQRGRAGHQRLGGLDGR